MSTSNSPNNEDRLTTEEKPKTLKDALRLLQESASATGTDKLTMEEIIEEIAADRRERRQREPARK